MKEVYYVLIIEGDVEPYLVGPYDTEDERDAEARQRRARDPEGENGIFALNAPVGHIEVGSYSAGYLEGDDA